MSNTKNMCQKSPSATLCVCVCVCERERERESIYIVYVCVCGNIYNAIRNICCGNLSFAFP